MTASAKYLLLGALVITLTSLLLACPESGSPRGPGGLIEPPPTQPGTLPGPSRHELPPTPIRMNKPKVLGPVAPAIVLLPENMGEPAIRVRLTGERDQPPVIKQKYRGQVEVVQLANGKYVAVNTLPMDSYLQGVLAKEIYASWSGETFRAQAMAARTYALFQLCTGDRKARAWDVSNDESSQMYGGIAGETRKSRDAVASTRGLVLQTMHNKQTGIFCTFYSSCSGVASQDPWEAWGDASVGPLKARALGDVDRICPEKYNWSGIVITKADIARCVAAWAQRNGIPYMTHLAGVRSVTISKRNAATNRPSEFAITDQKGRCVPIRAEEFRLALLYDPAGAAPKPWSSHFEIQDAGDKIVLVNGHGYGHGIGMSQWGAENLARKGWSHKQILAFYYPGSTVHKAW